MHLVGSLPNVTADDDLFPVLLPLDYFPGKGPKANIQFSCQLKPIDPTLFLAVEGG